MKKYIALAMAGMLCLMPALVCNNGKFECVLYGINTQDLGHVERALRMELELSPRQLNLLVYEAKEIHAKLENELTILTSKKDSIMLLGGVLGVWCCLGYSRIYLDY